MTYFSEKMKGIIVIQLVFLGLIFGLVAEKPSRDSDVLKSSRKSIPELEFLFLNIKERITFLGPIHTSCCCLAKSNRKN